MKKIIQVFAVALLFVLTQNGVAKIQVWYDQNNDGGKDTNEVWAGHLNVWLNEHGGRTFQGETNREGWVNISFDTSLISHTVEFCMPGLNEVCEVHMGFILHDQDKIPLGVSLQSTTVYLPLVSVP